MSEEVDAGYNYSHGEVLCVLFEPLLGAQSEIGLKVFEKVQWKTIEKQVAKL